jgi:dTDP-glucose pyrophosphorylase
MTARAIVLARGLGTRMRTADPAAALTDDQQRAADAGHKAMMPIAGRPFLDYVLSAAADAGLRRIALIVAPDHGVLREHYEGPARPTRLAVDFVVQPQPRGTADAVLAAEQWADGQPFVAINADNLYPRAALGAMQALAEPGLAGFDAGDLVRIGNIPAGRVRAFALVEQDDRGYLTRIVEKPSPGDIDRLGPEARVSMNCWRFDARIFDACRAVTPSARGELELPT